MSTSPCTSTVNSTSDRQAWYNPAVIYDRWLDMDDIIKRLGITAPRILEGHYNRGAPYLEMLNDGFDTEDPEIKANIEKMIARMDYDAIRSSRAIARNYKRAYYQHLPFFKKIKGYLLGQ